MLFRPAKILALASLAACSPPASGPAPERVAAAGVCFRVRGADATVVERNVANLETCAARLEVLRQQSGAPVEGRYQTVRLFVGADAIEAARTEYGPRFRVFEPEALAQLREATRRRLAAEAAPRRTGPPVVPGPPTP